MIFNYKGRGDSFMTYLLSMCPQEYILLRGLIVCVVNHNFLLQAISLSLHYEDLF